MSLITINETINPLHSETTFLINDTKNVSKQLRNSKYDSIEQYEKTIKWINNQLWNPFITAKKLLFKIAIKEITVPTNLSLHLVLNSLIKNGTDVNAKDDEERTPLHLAIINRHLELGMFLIEYGANVNAKDNYGKTPLHYAAKKGYTEIAEVLVQEGADLNAKDMDADTPLHLALMYGYTEIAQLLIEKGADVNVKNKNEETPLHWASEKGYLEIAYLLIENGADVHAKGSVDNWTSLHWASKNGKLEVARLLSKYGADVDAVDIRERTALHKALDNGHLEIYKLLKIIRHLDKKNSIDELTSDSENLTSEELKDYYNENKVQIDSLMEQRTKALIKKAITDLNEDISITIIKRGKSFLEDQLKIRSLQEICAIELQKSFPKDDNDPNYKDLKTYPDILQKILFKSYEPRINLSDKQITYVRDLLSKLT